MKKLANGGVRMRTLLNRGGWIKNGIMLDLYNQALCCDTTPTITTRINSCSHYWVIRIEYEKVNKRQNE